MIRRLVPIVLAITLVSCEGNTDRVRLVSNLSSTEIAVQAVADWHPEIGLTVAPGATEEIFMSSQLGGSDYVIHPYDQIDTLIIINSLGDTCQIDYSDSTQWEIHVEERSKIPADWLHEYTIVVMDEDF